MFSWEITLLLLLLPPFIMMGSTLKRKNLLLEEQILPFKGRPLLKGSHPLWKQTVSTKLFPFVKMTETYEP